MMGRLAPLRESHGYGKDRAPQALRVCPSQLIVMGGKVRAARDWSDRKYWVNGAIYSSSWAASNSRTNFRIRLRLLHFGVSWALSAQFLGGSVSTFSFLSDQGRPRVGLIVASRSY